MNERARRWQGTNNVNVDVTKSINGQWKYRERTSFVLENFFWLDKVGNVLNVYAVLAYFLLTTYLYLPLQN